MIQGIYHCLTPVHAQADVSHALLASPLPQKLISLVNWATELRQWGVQVIGGLSDSQQPPANQPGLLLWPVNASLLTDSQPLGTRIDSGFFAADNRKYQGSIVFDSHGGE